MAQSRWKASEVTFGPVGRVVATLVVIGVVLWLNTFAGIFALVLAPIYLSQVVPHAMRDIWRPVRLPPTEAEIIKAKFDAMDRAETPPAPEESIEHREAPRRW